MNKKARDLEILLINQSDGIQILGNRTKVANLLGKK